VHLRSSIVLMLVAYAANFLGLRSKVHELEDTRLLLPGQASQLLEGEGWVGCVAADRMFAWSLPGLCALDCTALGVVRAATALRRDLWILDADGLVHRGVLADDEQHKDLEPVECAAQLVGSCGGDVVVRDAEENVWAIAPNNARVARRLAPHRICRLSASARARIEDGELVLERDGKNHMLWLISDAAGALVCDVSDAIALLDAGCVRVWRVDNLQLTFTRDRVRGMAVAGTVLAVQRDDDRLEFFDTK
jgi:hypothetical protein